MNYSPSIQNHWLFPYLVCTYLCLSSVGLVQAQLQIQFPVSRIVFQRNTANQSTFSVNGTCPAGADRLEVRLTALQPDQGTFLDWQLLDANPAQSQFNGTVTSAGGWYRLDVRALQQGTVVATTSIDRVGIGEVFLLAGQSNARGLLGHGAVGAADDRVSCINYENAQNDTTQLPLPPVFAPVAAETFISPKGRSAWCWGRLGDLLASRLNVPILFYNVASAATTIRNWRESAQGLPTVYTFGDPLPPGMPYNQFKRVLKDYVSLTGVRAVLWHQGEAEPYDTAPNQQPPAYPTNYTSNLAWLIGHSRRDAGVDLPWMVARVSIDNNIAQLVQANRYQPVIDAQNLAIQTIANVFYGPETDGIQFPRTNLGAGVHFTDQGLIDLANAWNVSLTDAFFSTSTPVTPTIGQVDLQLAMQADRRIIAVNQPVTFSVTVTNQGAATAPQVRITNTLPPNLSFVSSPFFAFSQGSLSATIPSIAGGQSIVLTYAAMPLAAGFYQNAAEISSCGALDSDSHPGSDVADGEDDTGQVDFRTVESGNDLFRTPIRPTTPPPPAVIGNQPGPIAGLADLSLASTAGALVTAVGQFWSLTLTVTNQGGAAAQNVQVGCLLPANLSFSSSPNMNLEAGTIRGSLATIPAGGVGMLWFTAVPTVAGTATVRSQLEAATPGDPDSIPNNGFSNGEDDTAQSFIRVR